MVLFNNIPYKRICLTSKVNLTKRFSKIYKRMRLITRLYGTINTYLKSLQMLHPIVCTPVIKLFYFSAVFNVAYYKH